ncbi:MAG: hydrogenase iron-sulfur subunit [Methanosarcinales archaeon]|nr:hydrogenase iron-sulfur subunit [Methanosarcinales archaeon]
MIARVSEPAFIFEAFKDKVDGVLIMGCHIGDCHYIEGNVNAKVRINNTIEALRHLGLYDRLRDMFCQMSRESA